MNLSPFELVKTPETWRTCLRRLEEQQRLAIDLESNSLFAYREQICLIQISIADQDYVVDPLSGIELEPFGKIIADQSIEKVFHAAEYDLILMKREFGWQLNNLFDTMWAARILGIPRYGLANLLQDFYDVRQNKKHQKANWCRRPLSEALLNYAQKDTHYLLRLRDDLEVRLRDAGRLEEAHEIFSEQTDVSPSSNCFDPDGFWSINGTRDLAPHQQAVVKALYLFRDEQARKQNRPHFKIIGERTLMELAENLPEDLEALAQIYGMSQGQIKRYGKHLLHLIREAQKAEPPQKPKNNYQRPPNGVVDRYERLHQWRKETARARGVESDVIMSRDIMWELARSNPKSEEDLLCIISLGSWRRSAYGAAILRELK